MKWVNINMANRTRTNKTDKANMAAITNLSKDISSQNITISVPNRVLLDNTEFKVSYGRRYGLIGHNGIGKTTLLKYINSRKMVISSNLDIFYVEQEVVSDPKKTVFEHIISSNIVRQQLVDRLQYLLNSDKDDDETIDEINKLEEEMTTMGTDKDESIVRRILYGLGFDKDDQDKPSSHFSGGWRMRMSLAKALYIKPTLLLLDEPNNHLDLNATIWLTDYLSKLWKGSLIVVSHDKNFLNEVCTDIIQLDNKKLTYYKGNYDSFYKNYLKNRSNAEKEWKKIEKRVTEMRKKNTVKKDIDEFIKNNEHLRLPKVYKVKLFLKNNNYKYTNYSPLLLLDNVSFSYSNNLDKLLYSNINLRLESGDRITIVGKNGVGKSTLMKLMMGKLMVSDGEVRKDERIRIGYYHQHASEILPSEKTPIEYIQSIDSNLQIQDIRKLLGGFGLDSSLHTQQIGLLSGGQKSRVLFISLFVMRPHIMLLDEPTNHLDIETIEALIDSIKTFDGAIVTITHNIELIEKTNTVLYEISNKSIAKINFEDYYKKILDESCT